MNNIVHKLNGPPSLALGNDLDFAVHASFLYVKNNGRWHRISGDLGRINTSRLNEVAIWQGHSKMKSTTNLLFSDTNGLTIGTIDEATSDTDLFLVSDGGIVKFRTGDNLRSDLGISSTDDVVFASVDTGQGANELYDMDQNVKTDSAVTFTTITASTKFDHVMSIQTHGFYMAGTSEVYLPFGPSAIEGSSTADAANDDTLFIAPYAGSLEFIKLQTASTGAAAGATRMELRVNGTDGAYVQVTISNETTATFTWSSGNTFSAGDRLRITFDPTAAPKYVTATSVWKYTL